MLSPQDIVLSEDVDQTNCGSITALINPDVDFSKPIRLYSKCVGYKDTSKPAALHLDIFKKVEVLLAQKNKVVLEVDVAGWFDHMFTLYYTTEGVYVVDSYIWQHKLQVRPIDLPALFEMLIKVSEYVGLYSQCAYYDAVTQCKFWEYGTSPETFDGCAAVWYDFWGTRHITGARGALDYMFINCYS